MTMNNGISKSTGKHTSGKRAERWISLLMEAVFAFVLCSLLSFILSRTATEHENKDLPPPEPVTIQEEAVYVLPVETPVEEPKFYYSVNLTHDLQDYIRDLCEQYDVPMSLIIAMIDAESGFASTIVSRTNDYGLMQINIINHDWLREKIGVTNMLDPYQNVMSGIYILSDKLSSNDGDIAKALMSYNCGASGARKLWDEGIFTTSYTEKIMKLYDSYEKSRLGAGTP